MNLKLEILLNKLLKKILNLREGFPLLIIIIMIVIILLVIILLVKIIIIVFKIIKIKVSCYNKYLWLFMMIIKKKLIKPIYIQKSKYYNYYIPIPYVFLIINNYLFFIGYIRRILDY